MMSEDFSWGEISSARSIMGGMETVLKVDMK